MENLQTVLVGLRRASAGQFGEANLLGWCDSLEEALAEIKEDHEKLKEMGTKTTELLWSSTEKQKELKEENETLQNQYDMAIQVDNKEIACLKEELEELKEEFKDYKERVKPRGFWGLDLDGDELIFAHKEENKSLRQCIEKNWGKSGADILKEKDDHEEWRLKLAKKNDELEKALDEAVTEKEDIWDEYQDLLDEKDEEIIELKKDPQIISFYHK